MFIRYNKEEGQERGKWSFGWDAHILVGDIRNALVILACAKYLGIYPF
jgi:hypothetical protein